MKTTRSLTKKEKKELRDSTKWLDEIYNDVLYSLRLYCVENNIKSKNGLFRCVVCNQPTSWDRGKRKFGIFCSRKCRLSTEGKKIVQEKGKRTNLKKYSVENVYQSEIIKEKIKQTNLKKYGVEYPTQLKSIYNKVKQTKKERYGDENYCNKEKAKQTKKKRYGDETYCNVAKAKQTKKECYGDENYVNVEKIKKTMLERYGDKHSLQRKEIRTKAERTCIERYGVKHPTNKKEFKDKAKKTCIEKYGYKSPIFNEKVYEKARQTCREKFGTDYTWQSPKIINKIKSKRKSGRYNIFLNQLMLKNIVSLESKEDFINNNKEHQYQCLKCKGKFLSSSTYIQTLYCPTCHKQTSQSQYEIDIFCFLKQIMGSDEILQHKRFSYDKRRSYEIDIFLPKYKLGIEFHGLHWHSDIYKDKLYHQKKYLVFKNKGIRLIQIFENEWRDDIKQNIVKSIISFNLHKSTDKIYARKTKVLNISNEQYKNFLIVNHIQGYAPAKYKYGLFYNDKLVSTIGFSKNRFAFDKSVEIIRFCNEINVNVVGGFAKLLKHFENLYSPHAIVSFVNVRFFTGQSYVNNEFKMEYLTQPNYFYFKEGYYNILYSRIQFQKHKLKNKLEHFSEQKTEYENMLENSFCRIYDAGNIKFLKT